LLPLIVVDGREMFAISKGIWQ